MKSHLKQLPCIFTNAQDITQFGYKSTKWFEGCLVVSEEQGKPIKAKKSRCNASWSRRI